ncbi:MAG TPA: ABC transporter permease [Gemmataceae bacterium]|nr:ABC transporter permease [Gemmataceae bacterium]
MVQLFQVATIALAGLFFVAFIVMLSSAKGRRGCVLALRSLWLHKLRSFLSVLGIIIGTAAVISLMAFGEGSMQDALEDIKRLGATNIIIRGVKPPESNTTTQQRVAMYGLSYDDFALFGTIDAVTRRVPMRIFSQEFRHLDRKHNGRLVATLPEYAEVNQLNLARGRFLTKEDDDAMSNVAVLAANTADKLFPFEDPLDQSVRVGTYLYRVVGVVLPRMPTGGTGGSQAAEDFNDDVYIPLKTCRVRFGDVITIRRAGSFQREQVPLHQVTLTVSDIDKVRPVGNMVSDLLEDRHVQKDWLVTVPLDRLEHAQREKDRFTMLLVVIALISLLVGGIGIMNIMLATVTERTREIGVRRALGAKRRDITLQFLIEAIVQTTVGGLAGVLIGVAAIFLVPPIVEWTAGLHMPAKINDFSFYISLAVAISVGVLFGWYPARRAALLDPIEALRHE